jgi:hypothetical protein
VKREKDVDEMLTDFLALLIRKAIELFRRLEMIPELPRWDGATVDFHPDKPAVVFIPGEPTIIAAVENGELVDFLIKHRVRRVLVDAIWPSNVRILEELIDNGIEVFVLTRASALHGWRRKNKEQKDEEKEDEEGAKKSKKSKKAGKPKGLVEWLERHHPEVLKGFKAELKRDTYDAILLRYVKPKFAIRLTKSYIECWPFMLTFRFARRYSMRLKQHTWLPADVRRELLKKAEELEMEAAKRFVAMMRKYYPVDDLFKRFQIEDDLISQALCCEVIIEMHGSPTFADFLKKVGLTPATRENVSKWEEGRKEENDGERFIHDGKALDALIQLTIKIYGKWPKRGTQGILWKAGEIAKVVWEWLKEIEASRMGETLDRVTGPSRKERVWGCHTRPQGQGAPAKAGVPSNHTASVQGPRHPAVTDEHRNQRPPSFSPLN